MANMKMAGEEKVSAAACETFHCHACSPYQIPIVMTFWQIEWMMGHDYLNNAFFIGAKLCPHPFELLFVYPTAFDGERPCGVDTYHDHFIIRVRRH